MLQGLFGNASEVSLQEVQSEFEPLLVEGEQLLRAFRVIRDMFIFTDRRLILVDRQGVTGKKVVYHSIPYRSITHFEVETAGMFDGDAELKLHLSGGALPVTREFKRGTDIVGVHCMLAQCILR